MIGIKFKNDIKASEIAALCLDKGLLVLTAKDKLRFLPPLTITIDEIDKGLAILNGVLAGI
jgi:acetylornithine/N-succinyldiaminopimelate aminotransferase